MKASQEAHHPLVQLARAAIENYVRNRRIISPAEAPAAIEGNRPAYSSPCTGAAPANCAVASAPSAPHNPPWPMR